MRKVVISVLGTDRPGIVAAVSRILGENHCNIENATQTILQTEFAAIFIARMPKDLETDDLLSRLRRGLKSLGLHAFLKSMETLPDFPSPPESEPFVITTTGPDRQGLISGITEIMARFRANITNLKALYRKNTDSTERTTVIIYEVDVPVQIDHQAFRQALRDRADDLGLDLSIQHRDIFEAIHRV
ncbi:MAG: ACT domain-containing protein [Deltaproteobacteria bacterium]|nr:ACT domain-containing protein [Deltaproteobacteria bacterium]MBW2017113.1 ACT domain-containing protein [Deltaproteobacteria bacterium]MBW2129877.1 ACT domain-containing protein [Deltaproteobacteria bacterium]MBW2303114.1 ACT domain-containing protein [Deltaproteobacteria bacterium]